MGKITMFSLVMALTGCASHMAQMKIDPVKVNETQATLRIESPDLADYTDIPLFAKKQVDVTLSTFGGCSPDPERRFRHDDAAILGKAKLTPKEYIQSVTIPADADLAIYVDSRESLFGSTYICGRAVRFRSESAEQYVLHFKPRGQMDTTVCEMSLTQRRGGKEVPVTSARYAIKEKKGLWKDFWLGSALSFCAH